MFSTYFTARIILATMCLICIVLSDRSDGKTFDCKVRALEDYRDKRQITVYMRRYKTEITELMYTTFFDDVLLKEKYSEYIMWQFRGTKKGIKVKLPNSKDWDWIVLFCPLSMSGKLKSQIDPFINRIVTIDFDEYIPLDGRYIKDEVSLLLEFWKSIDRDRDVVQLVILGNKVTQFNPLFDYFKIEMSITNEKTRIYRGGTLAVQTYGSKEHREARSKTKFNMLVKDTDYEDYNSGGILNGIMFKKSTRKGFDYYCSFVTSKGEGSIWRFNSKVLISSYKRKDGFVISDKIYHLDRQEFSIMYGRFREYFRNVYNIGNLYFEDEKSFHLFEDMLNKIGV